jgi:hypothetical protein
MFLFEIWNLIIITNYRILIHLCIFLYVLGGCCYTCWSQICSLADHLFILCVQVPGRELLLHLADHLCILCVQVLGRSCCYTWLTTCVSSVFRCLVGSSCYTWLTTCLFSVYRCWVGSCCYTWLTTCAPRTWLGTPTRGSWWTPPASTSSPA